MKLLKSYWPHIVGALALLLSYIQPGLLQYVGFQKLNSPHATLWGIVAAILVAYHVTPPGAVNQLPGKWQGAGPKIVIAFFLLLFWPVILSAQAKPAAKVNGKSLQTKTVVARKNSMLHVLSNLPKLIVSGVKTVTDVGEYVTGKIHDGFVKLDTAADEYVEGQTQ
jgi:hypothetical protein